MISGNRIMFLSGLLNISTLFQIILSFAVKANKVFEAVWTKDSSSDT